MGNDSKAGPPRSLRNRLLHWIDNSPDPVLPSCAALAKALGVRTETLSILLRQLRDEGILDYRPGRRMRIAARFTATESEPGLPLRRLQAAERLVEELKGRILGGHLRIGETLPKREALAEQAGVSAETVSRAYSLLVDEGLVHRQGKRWVIGLKTKPIHAAEAGVQVILIVQARSEGWNKLRTRRTAAFAAEFENQARQHGIRLLPCVLDENSQYPSEAQGMAQVQALIRRHARLCLGCLLVARPNETTDLARIALELLQQGKPVIWFDLQEGGDLLRMGPLFTRAGFSESSFTQMALDTLHRLGHRTVGLCGLRHEESGWSLARTALLKERAKALRPPVILVDSRVSVDTFYSQHLETMTTILAEAHGAGTPRQRKCLDTLFQGMDSQVTGRSPPRGEYARLAERLLDWPQQWQQAPRPWHHLLELLPLLMQPDLTAIIFLRDAMARHFAARIAAMGIHVPEEVSLISYDNALDFTRLRVSTVDNGAGRLGYRAFHRLLGHLSEGRTRQSRHGSQLLAEPEIDHRGSLGAPDLSP